MSEFVIPTLWPQIRLNVVPNDNDKNDELINIFKWKNYMHKLKLSRSLRERIGH